MSDNNQQVTDSLPTPGDQSIHSFKPGDYVLVRSLKTLAQQDQPRFGPPTQVLLVTRTAVKVKGQPQWIHASRLRQAPPIADAV